jgi:hypothetical protein
LYLGQDDPQSAAGVFRIAAPIAQDHGFVSELAGLTAPFADASATRLTRFGVSSLERARGAVAAQAGDEDAAVSAFGLALAAARSANDLWFLAEVLSDYGSALVSFGRPDEAEPLLDEARELWMRMGAAAQLERLEQIGGARAEIPA